MELVTKALVRISEADLQRYIDVGNLPEWCASIEEVLSAQGSRGEIRTAWGEATIHRELINGGVRFSCPNNPHAMQWTVTIDPARASEVLIHLTTNRAEHEAEEQERLGLLVSDWRAGLEAWPARRAAKMKKPSVQCSDSFGGFG
ncbi:MAG: hypothetical protein ABFS08_03730 [Pseudomonadota bacterium]